MNQNQTPQPNHNQLTPDQTGQAPHAAGARAVLSHFDVRNSPAGRAVIESGVTFSRRDIARAALHDMVTVGPGLLVRGLASAVSESMGGSHTKNERRAHKLARANSGLANPVMRKKIGEGLLQSTVGNNPTYMHLAQMDLPATQHKTSRRIRAKLHEEAQGQAVRIQRKRATRRPH